MRGRLPASPKFSSVNHRGTLSLDTSWYFGRMWALASVPPPALSWRPSVKPRYASGALDEVPFPGGGSPEEPSRPCKPSPLEEVARVKELSPTVVTRPEEPPPPDEMPLPEGRSLDELSLAEEPPPPEEPPLPEEPSP